MKALLTILAAVLTLTFCIPTGASAQQQVAQDQPKDAIKAAITEVKPIDMSGTWKGKQFGQDGSWVFAKYRFWMQEGQLRGASEYDNIVARVTATAKLSHFKVSGDEVQFVAEYSGGLVDGTSALFRLTINGEQATGNARNLNTNFLIKVGLTRSP